MVRQRKMTQAERKAAEQRRIKRTEDLTKREKEGKLTAREKRIKKKERQAERKPKEVAERPTIQLQAPEKTIGQKVLGGIEKGVGKTFDVLKSPKTTAVLGGTLAALGGVGAVAGTAAIATGGRAVIARTAMKAGTTRTTQRAFVGKPATTGIDKIFNAGNREVTRRFATNAKSIGLTNSLIKKLGGVSALIGIIGSYPFAGFIKEEALQTLGFATKTASENNDVEGLQRAITEQEEILNPDVWEKLINKIPFANIIKQLDTFYKAARIKLENDKQTLANLIGDAPTQFETQQAEARQTKLEQRARDAEYFTLIREGRFEEAQTLLDTELEGGN